MNNDTINNICTKCYIHNNQAVIKDCHMCKKLALSENIFCQLTRGGQVEGELFECSAFRPLLILVDKKIKNNAEPKDKKIEENGIGSDKIKWFKAYAKQQLQINSDIINYKLKYHVCLSTRKREKIFANNTVDINKISSIFNNIGSYFKGVQISLLCLKTDHVHLFIESTPDYSLDEIVNKTIKNSEKDIVNTYSEIFNNNIWERNYYIESIG